MASITLRGISKSFFGTAPILNDVDLDIAGTDFCVFLGPSGCGKSTLLRIIAGLEDPTTGELLIDGRRVNEVVPAERGVAMVFQSYALFPHMTVAQNMGFGLREKGMPAAEQAEIAARFIAEVGLSGFEGHYPKQLSGGMQQRVALARALANDPKILLLDEPFGALDNQTRALMQELLLSIWELHKKTVLFVTHDIDEAIFMANRCVVFSARPGRIKNELAIDLPYPRHYTVKTTQRFSELKAVVTEDIRAETLRTVEMEKR